MGTEYLSNYGFTISVSDLKVNKNVKESEANVPLVTTASLKQQMRRFAAPSKRKRLLDY